MKFTPKTEKQIAEDCLRPAGIYSFEIVDATNEISKKGNEMIKLSLRLYSKDGDDCGILSDYLLESLAYKLRHAAIACGLDALYGGGTLDASDFIGKTGDLKLAIKRDKTGQYPDQNSVSDYLLKKSVAVDVDDGIPF